MDYEFAISQFRKFIDEISVTKECRLIDITKVD